MSGGRTLRQSDDSSLGIHSSTGRGPTVPHPALSATAHLSPKFSLSFFIDRTCGIQNTFISGKINPDKNTINRLFEPLPPSFRPGLPTSLSPATHYSSREISPLNREHRYNIERNHINQEQRPEKPTLLSNLTHSHKSPLPTSTGSTNTIFDVPTPAAQQHAPAASHLIHCDQHNRGNHNVYPVFSHQTWRAEHTPHIHRNNGWSNCNFSTTFCSKSYHQSRNAHQSRHLLP